MVTRFDDIFAAPDVVEKGSATLATAPHFLPGPDGLIAVYGKGDQRWFFDGFVTVVHSFGAFAAVEVEHQQHDEPIRDLYIVRADSLPAPASLPGVVLAADIGAYQFTTRPPRFVSSSTGLALWYADDPAPVARVLSWSPAGIYAVVEIEWSPFTDGAGETYTGERSILLCRRASLPSSTLTLRQAAAYCRVGRRMIKRLVKQGKLRGKKEGARWSFDWNDIVEYVKRNRKGG